MNDKQLNILGIVAIIVVILSILSIENIGFLNIGKKSYKKGYSIVIAEKTYESKEYGKIEEKSYFIIDTKDNVKDQLAIEKIENINLINKYFDEEVKKFKNKYNLRNEKNIIYYNDALHYNKNKENLINELILKKYNIRII